MTPEEIAAAAAAEAMRLARLQPANMVRRQVGVTVQRRAADVGTYNAVDHSVELIAATDSPIRMPGWRIGLSTDFYEILDMNAGSVDLSQVEAGNAPLLDSHSRYQISDRLGVVDRAFLEPGKLITKVRFSQSAKAQEVEADFAAGTPPKVSAGYRVSQYQFEGYQDELPIYRAIRWQFREVSPVPIAADPNAGARSEQDLSPCIIIDNLRTDPMTPEEIAAAAAAEAQRVAEANRAAEAARLAAPAPAAVVTPTVLVPAAVTTAAAAVAHTVLNNWRGEEVLDFSADARTFNIEDDQVRTWITTMTPDQARAQLVRAAADRQNQAAPNIPAGEAARVGVDARDHMREAMGEVLGVRAAISGIVMTDNGRRLQGMTLMEMGRTMLEANGFRTAGLNRRQLAQAIIGFDALHGRAHTTSDFPLALGNITNRTLRGAYDGTPQTFKTWMRRTTTPDFKQINRIQLSAAPALLEVPEGGEYQYGTMTEGREVYSLVKYGRKFGLTWEMIVNDDLDAFTKIPRAFGARAAELESDVAYAPLLLNPNMADGNAIFSAAHNNLAGAGADLSEASIQALDIMLGSQTGLNGEAITVAGKYLLTGIKWKLQAKKLTTATTPNSAADINAYAGEYQPIIERRLNGGAGATPYYLMADNATIDTGEYCYLEGDEGVYLEERTGFDVDQVEYKARLVMAAKIIDHRGMAKNPGT